MNRVVRLGAALLGAASVALWCPPSGRLVGVTAAAGGCPAAAHHAEVVVEHASGASLAVCVGFPGPSISGLDLIRQSGIEVDLQQYGGAGEAVCQLDNEPQPVPGDCFGTSSYWALFVSVRCSGWQYAYSGASSQDFADGDLEGFHYVPQRGTPTPPGPPGGQCPPTAAPSPVPPAPTAPPRTAVPTRVPVPPPASSAHSPTPGVAPPTTAPTTTPTAAVALLPVQTEPPPPTGTAAPAVTAGPLERTGAAPPPPSSGAPLWAWALGGALAAGLIASLCIRMLRRRT